MPVSESQGQPSEDMSEEMRHGRYASPSAGRGPNLDGEDLATKQMIQA